MKDYKKILEGIVNIINTTEKSDIGFANICSYIGENCPELKESEDEEVRKEIITFISTTPKQRNRHPKWISWLEKQDPKKHEEELEKAYKTADKVQYRRGYEAAMKEMEKQGESYTKKDVDNASEGKEYSCRKDCFLTDDYGNEVTGLGNDNFCLAEDKDLYYL